MRPTETQVEGKVSTRAIVITRLYVGLAIFFGTLSVAVVLLFANQQDQDTEIEFLATGCDVLVSSVPTIVNQAGKTYCLSPTITGTGIITVAADGVTIDGSALRGTRAITEYASWRATMPVTGVSIQGRTKTTIHHLDVNGAISVGAVNNASAASPETVVRESTMRSFLISGAGPVWILDNIIHATQGTGRTKIISGVDQPDPGTVVRSDYVISGNVIMSDDTSQSDEPSFAWLYRSPQTIISNNYFYATEASAGALKDIIRVRDDSSFGYIENNKWGYRPPWFAADNGNGSTNGEASPLQISATTDGPAFPRGNVFRNNYFRNYTGQAVVTQGWGRGNVFTNNVFIGSRHGLSTIPGQSGLANNTFTHNTFVNYSTSSGAVFVDDTGSNTGSITFSENIVANLVGSRTMQCDHLGANALTGTKNLFFGTGTMSSCFDGTAAIKNQNPGFVNPIREEAGDFHVTYCSDPDAYRGAFPCNLSGQTRPTVPLQLTATVLPSDRPAGIDLTWAPSRDDVGVANYQVERVIDGGTPQTIATGYGPGILGPSTVDFLATSGHTYIYRVKAVDLNGLESDWSAPVTVAYPDPTVPPSPARSIVGSLYGTTFLPIMLGMTSYEAAPDPTGWPKFVVEVKADDGTPLPYRTVTIDFSNSTVRMWNYQRSNVTLNCTAKTLTVQTDANGRAMLSPQYGKYDLSSAAVQVSVNGVVLKSVVALSADLNGTFATNPNDLSLFLKVSLGSCSQASTCATFSTASAHADYNWDQRVNPIDMSLLSSARFASDTKENYCP